MHMKNENGSVGCLAAFKTRVAFETDHGQIQRFFRHRESHHHAKIDDNQNFKMKTKPALGALSSDGPHAGPGPCWDIGCFKFVRLSELMSWVP